MSLRYTPTLSGVKEDILLDAYSGVNSFTFRLNTGGLNLYQANGRCFLAESKVSTERIELGEVVTYDAKSKFSIGTMTAQTIMPGQAYMLTLTVDEAFLTDENTTYPVTIDPTLTVSYGNDGDNYIIDAPIFEGYPNNNYGAFQYNRVGYVDSSYQSGRTVVKLPVLTNSSIYTSLTADDITSVKFHVKEATGSGGISVSLYPLTSNSTWTETNVTWNKVGSKASTATDAKTLTDSAWSAFDITALVKQWKNGTYNANCGFIMIGASENSLDKSFCSSEHERTSYRPYVVLNYTAGGGSISASTNRVNEGAYLQLSAPEMTGAVTWTSSNTNIATVTSEGIVEGVHAGQVTITAQAEGYTDCTFSLWVTLPDGIYYFNNADSNLSMYNNKSSNVYAESQVTTDPYRVYRLWKTQYVSDGMYLLQPLHDTSVYLTTGSSGSVYVAEMPQSVAGSSAKWKIAWNAFGYAINYLGSSYRSLHTSSTGETTTPLVIAGTWQASFIYNWIPVSADGVFLRDTTTLETITSSTAFNIELGQSSTLDDFGLAPEYYGGVQGVSWSSSYGAAGVNSHTGKVISIRCGKATISINAIINGVQYSAAYSIQITGPVTFYGIANAGHDHDSSLTSAKTQLESNSWNEVTLQTGSVAANTCKNNLLATSIFTSRSHGIVAHSEYEDVPLATGIVLNDNTTNVIAFYSHYCSNMTSESTFISSGEDYCNIDVALFIACETGYGGKGANNLPTMIVNCGAKAAIGFTDPIICVSANTWTSRFYTALLWGYSLGDAVDYASEPFDEYSGLSREQVIICGDASLILS